MILTYCYAPSKHCDSEEYDRSYLCFSGLKMIIPGTPFYNLGLWTLALVYTVATYLGLKEILHKNNIKGYRDFTIRWNSSPFSWLAVISELRKLLIIWIA